ncbi:MAG: hypothetical protein OEY96_09930 [Gammaproteobacteria bacterium]|nr:hypothetical protein [Gammaproteobacteria bacterium]
MSTKSNVLVIGYGEMGRAMEHLLSKSHNLFFWDKFPPTDLEPVILEDAVPQADFVIFCLPVQPHEEVLQSILSLLKPDTICISIAKGLDKQGRTAQQIFASKLEKHQYAMIYGPMISEEIRLNRPAFAQVGCHKITFQSIADLFKDSKLYLQHSNDVVGIGWSVILKNVYAMVFGMNDALQLGVNMRGFLAVTALAELDQIVQLMGGNTGSPYHLAGLGDLITTATSLDSHHHKLGEMLAAGETENIKGEGVNTLQMVKQHQLFDTTLFPLFSLIDHIIENRPVDVAKALDDFLVARQQ